MDNSKPIQTTNDSDELPPESLRFDRRRSHRHETAGHVTLLRQSPARSRMQFPVCSIHMFDISSHGIGARCDMPLTLNEPVSVFLPPHGGERGVDIVGHITRIDPAEPSGYRIGIEFDPRPAA